MRRELGFGVVLAGLTFGSIAIAQDSGVARPHLLLRQDIDGMPTGGQQEISVLIATLKSGDKTVFHTHRFPVTIYILEGAFTLEMEGRPPVTVKAGESLVEPANVKMTGYNRSASEPMRVVIFSVADPGAPFLDLIQ